MAKGLYFEDLAIGWTAVTKGRTVTEADVVHFAGISGDYNPIHTDAKFASETEFGQRVVHGVLGLSIATGLIYQEGMMEDTIMAFLGLEWKFSAPIFFGDTVHAEVEINALKPMRRLGGGKVTLDVKVVNQEGKITQKGEWTVLVRSRPEDEEGTG